MRLHKKGIASVRQSKKFWKGAGTSQPILFRPEARSLNGAHRHPLLPGLLSPVLFSEHNITAWSLPWRLTIQARETACSDTFLNKLQMYKRETRWNLRKQHLKYSKSVMTNWPNLWPIKIIFLPKTTNILIASSVPTIQLDESAPSKLMHGPHWMWF